jgi:hypothetical protein
LAQSIATLDIKEAKMAVRWRKKRKFIGQYLDLGRAVGDNEILEGEKWAKFSEWLEHVPEEAIKIEVDKVAASTPSHTLKIVEAKEEKKPAPVVEKKKKEPKVEKAPETEPVVEDVKKEPEVKEEVNENVEDADAENSVKEEEAPKRRSRRKKARG